MITIVTEKSMMGRETRRDETRETRLDGHMIPAHVHAPRGMFISMSETRDMSLTYVCACFNGVYSRDKSVVVL